MRTNNVRISILNVQVLMKVMCNTSVLAISLYEGGEWDPTFFAREKLLPFMMILMGYNYNIANSFWRIGLGCGLSFSWVITNGIKVKFSQNCGTLVVRLMLEGLGKDVKGIRGGYCNTLE